MAEAAIQASCEVVRLWPPAEPAVFQDAVSRLPTAAAIVACNSAEGPRGLLATSLAAVSTTPPRLLFCVDKAAAAHMALIAAESVAISLLGADQEDVADALRADSSALDAPNWRIDAAGPELRGAPAVFTGPVRCRIDAGAATIFVLDVSNARSHDGARLIHLDGELRTAG